MGAGCLSLTPRAEWGGGRESQLGGGPSGSMRGLERGGMAAQRLCTRKKGWDSTLRAFAEFQVREKHHEQIFNLKTSLRLLCGEVIWEEAKRKEWEEASRQEEVGLGPVVLGVET